MAEREPSKLGVAGSIPVSRLSTWGPVQCSGAARPPNQRTRSSRRAPQTPSAGVTALAVSLPPT